MTAQLIEIKQWTQSNTRHVSNSSIRINHLWNLLLQGPEMSVTVKTPKDKKTVKATEKMPIKEVRRTINCVEPKLFSDISPQIQCSSRRRSPPSSRPRSPSSAWSSPARSSRTTTTSPPTPSRTAWPSTWSSRPEEGRGQTTRPDPRPATPVGPPSSLLLFVAQLTRGVFFQYSRSYSPRWVFKGRSVISIEPVRYRPLTQHRRTT